MVNGADEEKKVGFLKAAAFSKYWGGMLIDYINCFGFTGGIERFFITVSRHIKKQALEFLALKGTSLKTYLLMKYEAIKSFVMTRILGQATIKTLREGIRSLWITAKELFSKLPGIVKGGLAVYAAIKFIKGIKAAFDGLVSTLDTAKEKVQARSEK